MQLPVKNRTVSFFDQFTLAHRTAVVCFLGGLAAAAFEPSYGLLPFLMFLGLCLTAPFMPRFSFFLPIISKGNASQNAIALTFDDGPDPLTTPLLLNLLEKHGLSATFFVTGQRASVYPHLLQKILKKGHTIGNHSFSHDYFAMFKGIKQVKNEICLTQNVLQRFGIRPLIYRPPVGITYPGLGRILSQQNMYAVNFSCRAFDRGNRSLKNLAGRILARVKAGDIVMLHDVAPPKSELCAKWLDQLESLFIGFKHRDLAVLPLAQLIARPIFEPIENVTKTP